MNSVPGGERPRSGGRKVGLAVENRQVRWEGPDGETSILSYPGMSITSYEAGRKVAQTWVPLGADPTEADDEQVIEHLRRALLWQARQLPDTEAGDVY
jgi:hypothetical protein